FHDECAALAKKFIEDFEPYDYIVTPSGSCAAMMREQYEHLLGDDPAWKSGMQRVKERTYEFSDFLDKVLKVDISKYALPRRQSITYHYTCHMRGLGITDEPVKMLQALGNVDFRPLEKTDQCCGFGGTFAVK